MNSTLQRLGRILAASIGLLIILLCIQTGFSQETRGTIRGTVTDPNGQAVPNASVQVIDPARGKTVSVATNGQGYYQALYLVPGSYQIVVEATGFKKSIRDNVVLQINGTVEVNVPLEVGGAQESVTVTSDIPQLNTENASLGQVVDGRSIADLPLVHGDAYTLIGLSPGVSSTGDPRLDRPFEPTHIVGFAINGVRGNRMDLTIDGVASTATANANEVIASYVPPSEIIQEFKVQTATFDAQFGNTEGAVTSISIKSGTNALHGSCTISLNRANWLRTTRSERHEATRAPTHIQIGSAATLAVLSEFRGFTMERTNHSSCSASRRSATLGRVLTLQTSGCRPKRWPPATSRPSGVCRRRKLARAPTSMIH